MSVCACMRVHVVFLLFFVFVFALPCSCLDNSLRALRIRTREARENSPLWAPYMSKRQHPPSPHLPFAFLLAISSRLEAVLRRKTWHS